MLDLVLASLDFESLANVHQTNSALRRLVERYLEIHKQRQATDCSEATAAARTRRSPSTAQEHKVPGADEALLNAAAQGKTRVVQFTLFRAGADVHTRDEEALRAASEFGHVDTVRILLHAPKRSADADRRSASSLRCGRFGVVLEAGADQQVLEK
jgi:hypothetical protein